MPKADCHDSTCIISSSAIKSHIIKAAILEWRCKNRVLYKSKSNKKVLIPIYRRRPASSMRPKGGDRSAGKAESKVGNFLFRSKWANGVWDFSTASPFYVVRLVGAVLISVVLVGRCGRLFLHTRQEILPLSFFSSFHSSFSISLSHAHKSAWHSDSSNVAQLKYVLPRLWYSRPLVNTTKQGLSIVMHLQPEINMPTSKGLSCHFSLMTMFWETS